MTSSKAPGNAASSEFRAFLDRDWVQWLAEAPEVATVVGYPGLNDRWMDDSPAGIADRRHHLATSLKTLDGFDRASLSPAERLNYDLYRELLVSTEGGLEFGNDPFPFRMGAPHNSWMPLNQLESIHLTVADMVDLQPLATVRDYEDLLKRFDAFPVVVDRNLELLESGRRRGFTPPKITLPGVPDQISAHIQSDPAKSSLLKPFLEFPSAFSPADRQRLLAEASRLHVERIVPSLTKWREYLVTTYLPNCRDEVGAGALPNGAAAYAFLVQWHTTTDLTPRQVHDIGTAEVRRLRTEMEALIAKTGFPGTFAEFNEFLRTDPRFFYDSAEALLDGYRVIAKKADPALGKLFGRLPRSPYGVVAVPDVRAPTSPGAYYMSGAPSTGRAGYFYANTFKVGVRPRWEMEALTLHESVPGHHLQISLAQELSDLPDFRRETGFTAFVEGWGLYAESLGEELGFYRDPYSKFGQLTYDMWRSIRLVVDTGMHALGWTRERAMHFFRENSGKSDQDIRVEIDRYIVWPGQALAYKIGQLKFRELRTTAERRLGDRFDVRAFHDALLEHGAIPLGELTRRIDAWIDARAAT
ncbi:MAG: DUF885 domain-containing protein [Thermoplasmata archaeon]